jgi:lysophospholipase L1-like esterase
MTRTRFLSLCLGVALLGGACGGGGSTPDTPPDTSVHMIDADDANIQYTGRIDFTNAKLPKFALGATYVTARFKGVGVTALIKDEHRYGMWRNYYDAVIDDAIVSKIKINDDVAMYSYPIVSDLPYGEHEITIVKRTEPNVGLGYFGGFEIAGVILPPPDLPAHKMLIFGDSITAGSGTEVPDGDPGCSADGWGQPVQNADVAYGPVAARMLDADYHVVGVSGIGLVRNYQSDPNMGDIRPMPQVYNLTLPEMTAGSATWSPASYQPDAIVVALGTNDFSPGPINPDNTPVDGRAMMDVGAFATAYIAFVDALRSDYPAAHVFAMGSPMLADGWPTAAYQAKTSHELALAMVADHYATGGDSRVHKVSVTKVGGGCGTHPNVAGQMTTATELATAVKTALAW